MQITWFGTASLLIEAEGAKILFDPYLRKFNKKLPRFPFEKVANADAIIITHPHIDHFADVSEVMKHTSCPVYVNARGLEIAKKLKFDLSRIHTISFGDELTFGGIKVKAYRGRHVEYDKQVVKGAVLRALKGHIIKALKLQSGRKKYAIGEEDIFSFCVSQGEKTLLVMGSANRAEGETFPKIDAFVCPYQGRSNMLEYSAELVKFFSPDTVIIDHFDDAFPPLSSTMNVEEFKLALESATDIKVIIPAEQQPVTLF